MKPLNLGGGIYGIKKDFIKKELLFTFTIQYIKLKLGKSDQIKKSS